MYNCNPCEQAPDTNQWFTMGNQSACVARPVCKVKIPARCVIYDGPNLTGLGLGSHIDVETILATISALINKNTLKISQDGCNPLTIGSDGGILLDIDALLACLNQRGCDPCGTGACLCVAPNNFHVTYDQSGLTDPNKYRANITWTASAGAQAYTIEYKLTAASNWQIAASNVTGVSNSSLVVDLGSDSARSYDFRIKSLCSGCDSIYVYQNGQVVAKCPVLTNFIVS